MCSMTSSIFKGGLRISLFPLIRSDIFYFIGFLLCFCLNTVPFEAEWSDEAVDGLSCDDGVKVDWVFNDEVSVEAGGKDVDGVTLPFWKWGGAVCSQMGFQNRFKGGRFLTVFDTCDKCADNCVRNTTFFESWNWLNWNSDVVWSAISFNWGHWRRVARTIAMSKHLGIWMSIQDVNENGWRGIAAAIVVVLLCSVLFHDVFS